MSSRLDIYNLAFGHLGEALVTTLTEDPVAPNVAKANAQWNAALETALCKAPWLCALEAPLLPLDVPPPQGWGDWKYPHRFTCPTGTLKVWTIDDCDESAKWQRGAAVDEHGAATVIIKADWKGPLRAEVVVKRPPEALTPLLVDALGMLLAARLAGPIKQDASLGDRWLKRADEAFLLAEASEAGEIGGQDPTFGMGGLSAARLSAG